MLRKFTLSVFRLLIEAGYGDEILAEPLLDAASPPPAVRTQIQHSDVEHNTKTYRGAHPAYLVYHQPGLFLCDSPFEPALLPWIYTGYVLVTADHHVWAHALEYGRRCRQVNFEHISLENFLNIIAASGMVFDHRCFYDTIMCVSNEHADLGLYANDELAAEARALPEGTLQALGVSYEGNNPDEWAWLTHNVA